MLAIHTIDGLAETPVLPDIVVAEACWLLRSSKRAVRGILELTASGAVQVVHLFGPDQPPIAEMMDKYWPRMDLADACVLALADRMAGARVITIDRTDFTFYRLRNGQQVPIIVPQGG
ncbi:MAG: PIN domain-containing protein [Verrucomicrobiota bacterium]